MPSKKLDSRVHKRLVLQVQKYREAQKKATRKIDDSSKSSDSSDHGYSDHEEDHDRSHESVSSKENQNDNENVDNSDKVTTEDIKNLVLASYRSLSKQITNLSDQIEDAASRLTTLESLIKNVGTLAEKPAETILNEEVRKTRGSLTKNKVTKDVENVVIIQDSESSDSGSSSSSKSYSDSSSESDSDSKKKEKNSIKVFDTSIRLKFPLQTENDFCIFNAKIAKYSYRNRVINNLSHMVNKNSSLSRNVDKMIRHYLTKNVTMHYNTKVSTIKKKLLLTRFFMSVLKVIKKIFGESKPISDERIHVSITAALKFGRKK